MTDFPVTPHIRARACKSDNGISDVTTHHYCQSAGPVYFGLSLKPVRRLLCTNAYIVTETGHFEGNDPVLVPGTSLMPDALPFTAHPNVAAETNGLTFNASTEWFNLFPMVEWAAAPLLRMPPFGLGP